MKLTLAGVTDPQARALRDATADLASDGGFVRDLTMLETAIAQIRPEMVAIYLGLRPGQTLQLIRKVKALYPACQFIAIADETGQAMTQSCVEAGCADIVLLAECPRDLHRAVEGLRGREKVADADGLITAVIGAKGGMGTTTVAANLAAELASRNNQRVALVDLHVYLGNAAVLLDVKAKPTVLWFLQRGSMADPRTWSEAPPVHRGGFRVFGLDGDVTNADPISAEQIVFLCERLKERYDHIVIDAGSDINEVSLTVCSAAQRRLVVLADEKTARVGAIRRREAIKALDLGPQPARVVLNRAHDVTPESLNALGDLLGLPVAGAISNAWAEVQLAQDQGQVLRLAAPRAQVTRDFKTLVDALGGANQAEEDRRKRTFFTFFR